MLNRIGPREVRITNVYTVEAREYSAEHDSTPNWTENQVPSLGGGAATNPPAFTLRIQVEAGATIAEGPGTYQVRAKAICLTNPWATFVSTIDWTSAVETFNTAGWELRSPEEAYRKSWSIDMHAGGGPALPAFETGEVWQYFVSLIDNAAPGAAKQVACTAKSEPFILLD